MRKKIPGTAFEIAFDDEHSRYFVVSRGNVRVFDSATNKKITTLRGLSYTSQVYVSVKNNIIAVMSTIGGFAFYTADKMELMGYLKIRNIYHTDHDFCYDEEENLIYVIASKNIVDYLCTVSPTTLQYTKMPLEQLDGPPPRVLDSSTWKKYAFTKYDLYRHDSDGFYVVRDFKDTRTFGRFELHGNSMVLAQEYTYEQFWTIVDSSAFELGKYLDALDKKLEGGKPEYYSKHFAAESGFYLMTTAAVYRCHDGDMFDEIFRGDYLSDVAEHNGRIYICTWENIIIEDIPD